MSKNIAVTEEEKELFVKEYRNGASIDEISKKSKRNRKSVLKFLGEKIGKLKDPNRISKEKLLEFFEQRASIKKMLKYFRASQYTLKNRIKELGLWERFQSYYPDMKLYGDKVEKEICFLYEKGYSYDEIIKELNVPRFLVQLSRERHNQPLRERDYDKHRKWKLFHGFFEKIDTEEKAYFLGLLCADGCLSRDTTVSIFLQKRDCYILERFSNLVFLDKKELYSPKNRNAKGVVFNSKKMFNDLGRYGLKSRKSLDLIFPPDGTIPENLMNHFIRGAFDGDGCIGIYKSGKNSTHAVFHYIGSRDFVEVLNNKITLLVGRKARILKKDKVFYFTHSAKDSIIKIYNYLYKDSTIFLTRKKEKFEAFLKIKT